LGIDLNNSAVDGCYKDGQQIFNAADYDSSIYFNTHGMGNVLVTSIAHSNLLR